MKNFKFLLLIFSISILTLFSCSVNNNSLKDSFVAETTFKGNYGFERANGKIMAAKESIEEMAIPAGDFAFKAIETSGDYDNSVGEALSDRKIIKTVDLNTETKFFNESIDWLKKYIESFDGIIDNSYIDSGNINNINYNKNASFTVRVPAEKLDNFLNEIGDNLNVTFRHENINDITDEYTDIESRLKSLKIEEESLNEMLKKAKTVDEMIKVEDKLSSVRSDIENITRKLNRYDKQITYSTVYISVLEVRDLTEQVTIEEDFSKETLVKKLKKNFEEVKLFLKRLGANIFTNIPWIILTLAAILIFTIIIAIIKLIANPDKHKQSNDIKVNDENIKKDDDIKEEIISKENDFDKKDEVEVEFYQEEKS